METGKERLKCQPNKDNQLSEAESIVDNIEAVLKAENAGDNRRKRKQLLKDMTDFFIHTFKNVRFDEDGRYAETLGTYAMITSEGS